MLRTRICLTGILLALMVAASPLAAAPLKLSTWNIDWLTLRPPGDRALPADVGRRSPAQFARLAQYARWLGADVVALQEVDGPVAATKLFPPGRYALHFTADRTADPVGFAIRRGIRFTANPDLAGVALRAEGHTGLRSGADITLHLPGGDFRLLAVHLKAGCHAWRISGATSPACRVLGEELPPLARWIAARRREGVAFAVLGDFNRWMTPRDPFWRGLAPPGVLLRATDARSNPCWGGTRFIDQIMLGGAARRWLASDSLRVLVYKETTPAAKKALSDHCPVSVTLAPPG